MQFYAQEAKVCAQGQPFSKRVARDGAHHEIQMLCIRCLHKAWPTHEHGGPGSAVGIHRPRQHEGQLLEESLVLLRHGVADDALPDIEHALADAQPVMHSLLSGMEGVVMA
jgi:hypothetical protein